jgi:hypothetical protein
MPQRPVSLEPGRDGDPGRAEEDWLAWCESVEDQLSPDEEEPDEGAAPWDVDLDALIAQCREITAEEAAFAARAVARGLPGGTPVADGRRGPGQPGSAVRRPGEFASRAAGFGAGMLLDVMPGCGALAGFAAEAAGDDDRYAGACDDEVAGAISAWDRVEAWAAARKHAAVAEFIRRRPRAGSAGEGSAVEGAARMPQDWDESITAEVAGVLAESRHAADGLLGLAHDLEVKLPGTRAAFYDGTLRQSKVAIIARATAVLDPAEARAAEKLVLDRAGRLTPGALRAAIARAVMEVAPKKAKKRREVGAKFARVERWAEESGNATLAGRELAPDEVLAADQRITARAQELKKAGLEGDMDVLRARAYLDLLLGQDSRPGRDGAANRRSGFAGRITLTAPLATLTDLADRPGEMAGLGPVDPWLTRDLASAAAANPRTTWCVTVTDEQGHSVAHGCGRPEPKRHRKRAGPGARAGPGFSFAPTAEPGTWRLRVPGAGPDLLVSFDPIDTGECDHRFEAKGHNPGVKLRHLTQVRYARCTGPGCRRPAATCDFEHNIPYETGGRTCLCNGGPKCRQDHRLKQDSRWTVDQLPDGTFRWTTPTGRQYITEPTRYPV